MIAVWDVKRACLSLMCVSVLHKSESDGFLAHPTRKWQRWRRGDPWQMEGKQNKWNMGIEGWGSSREALWISELDPTGIEKGHNIKRSPVDGKMCENVKIEVCLLQLGAFPKSAALFRYIKIWNLQMEAAFYTTEYCGRKVHWNRRKSQSLVPWTVKLYFTLVSYVCAVVATWTTLCQFYICLHTVQIITFFTDIFIC